MNSATFLQILKDEFQRFYSCRAIFIFSAIGMPVLCVLLVCIFWNGVVTAIPIGILDYDKSSLSREFINMVDASPYLNNSYNLQSGEDGLELIRSGKINGILVIPENFEKDILSGRQSIIAGRYNNQYLTQGGTLSKAFTEVTATFAAKYDTARFVSLGIPTGQIHGFVMPVSVTNHVLFNPSLDYSWFLLLGIVPAVWHLGALGVTVYMFGTFFNAVKTGADKSKIKVSPYKYFTALSAHYLLWFFLQYIFVIFLLFGFVRIPLNGSLAIILAGSLLFTAATVFTAIFIIGILKRINVGISAASVYASPAFAYSGVTFPYEAMPFAAKVWSSVLPLPYMHRIFINIGLRNAPVYTALSPFTALFLYCLVMFFAGFFVFKRRLISE